MALAASSLRHPVSVACATVRGGGVQRSSKFSRRPATKGAQLRLCSLGQRRCPITTAVRIPDSYRYQYQCGRPPCRGGPFSFTNQFVHYSEYRHFDLQVARRVNCICEFQVLFYVASPTQPVPAMTMTLRLYLAVHKQPQRLRHASPPTLAERWLEGAYLLKRMKSAVAFAQRRNYKVMQGWTRERFNMLKSSNQSLVASCACRKFIEFGKKNRASSILTLRAPLRRPPHRFQLAPHPR